MFKPFILLIFTIFLSACTPVTNSPTPADIGDRLEMQATIKVDQPRPNTTITSPLTITGEARGTFFFEATFPIKLLDSTGQEITTTPATTPGDWMTEEFVPFTAILSFPAQPAGSQGTLVLAKDNPSGLAENALSLEIPVRF